MTTNRPTIASPSTSYDPNRVPALLYQLVTNALDPGYAAAAERRHGHHEKPSKATARFESGLLAVGCALAGFVLVVGYLFQHRSAPTVAKVQAELVNRVKAAESAGNSLSATARSLSGQIDNLREAQLGGGGAGAGTIATQELLAGQIAAKGPGVQVTLGDPPAATATAGNGRAGSTPIAAVSLLTDRDVRDVVNQLWADGAEAVSVNDIRLTPTSAIRFAGEVVLVDFQPVTSPYVIRAIGNADALDTGFAASAIASRYQTLAAADGIKFSFDEEKSMTLPASAPVNPQYASLPPTPSATASGSAK